MADLNPLTEDERAEIIAYLDGELDAKTARRVEAKLNRDPRAKAEADSLRRTWELLDYLPRPEPTPSFSQRTVQQLTAQITKTTPVFPVRRRLPGKMALVAVGWAAALALVGTASYSALARFRPKEPDDEQLIRYLRIVENKKYYEEAEDMEFLRLLDDPEVFGDDGES